MAVQDLQSSSLVKCMMTVVLLITASIDFEGSSPCFSFIYPFEPLIFTNTGTLFC